MKMNAINLNPSSVKFKGNPKVVTQAVKAGEYVLKDVPAYMEKESAGFKALILGGLAAGAAGVGVTALKKGNEVEQTTTDNNVPTVEEPKQESLVPLNKVFTIRDFTTTDPAAEALKNELLTYEENWQKTAGMTLYPNGMVENVTKDFKETKVCMSPYEESTSYNVNFTENGYLKNSSYSMENDIQKISFSINTDKDGRIVSHNKTDMFKGKTDFNLENKYTYNNDGTITSEFISDGRYEGDSTTYEGVLKHPFKAGINTSKVIDIDGKKFINIKSEGKGGYIRYYVQPLESYWGDNFTGVIGNKKMITDIPDINYVETIESEEKLQTNFLEPAKQERIFTTIKNKSTGEMKYLYFNTQTDRKMKVVIMGSDGNSSHDIYDTKTGNTKVSYEMQEDKLTTVYMYDDNGQCKQRINLTEDGEIGSTVDFEVYEDGSYKASVKPTNGEPYVLYRDKDGNEIEPKE